MRLKRDRSLPTSKPSKVTEPRRTSSSFTAVRREQDSLLKTALTRANRLSTTTSNVSLNATSEGITKALSEHRKFDETPRSLALKLMSEVQREDPALAVNASLLFSQESERQSQRTQQSQAKQQSFKKPASPVATISADAYESLDSAESIGLDSFISVDTSARKMTLRRFKKMSVLAMPVSDAKTTDRAAQSNDGDVSSAQQSLENSSLNIDTDVQAGSNPVLKRRLGKSRKMTLDSVDSSIEMNEELTEDAFPLKRKAHTFQNPRDSSDDDIENLVSEKTHSLRRSQSNVSRQNKTDRSERNSSIFETPDNSSAEPSLGGVLSIQKIPVGDLIGPSKNESSASLNLKDKSASEQIEEEFVIGNQLLRRSSNRLASRSLNQSKRDISVAENNSVDHTNTTVELSTAEENGVSAGSKLIRLSSNKSKNLSSAGKDDTLDLAPEENSSVGHSLEVSKSETTRTPLLRRSRVSSNRASLAGLDKEESSGRENESKMGGDASGMDASTAVSAHAPVDSEAAQADSAHAPADSEVAKATAEEVSKIGTPVDRSSSLRNENKTLSPKRKSQRGGLSTSGADPETSGDLSSGAQKVGTDKSEPGHQTSLVLRPLSNTLGVDNADRTTSVLTRRSSQGKVTRENSASVLTSKSSQVNRSRDLSKTGVVEPPGLNLKDVQSGSNAEEFVVTQRQQSRDKSRQSLKEKENVSTLSGNSKSRKTDIGKTKVSSRSASGINMHEGAPLNTEAEASICQEEEVSFRAQLNTTPVALSRLDEPSVSSRLDGNFIFPSPILGSNARDHRFITPRVEKSRKSSNIAQNFEIDPDLLQILEDIPVTPSTSGVSSKKPSPADRTRNQKRKRKAPMEEVSVEDIFPKPEALFQFQRFLGMKLAKDAEPALMEVVRKFNELSFRRLKTILIDSGRSTVCLADVKQLMVEAEFLPAEEPIKNWSLSKNIIEVAPFEIQKVLLPNDSAHLWDRYPSESESSDAEDEPPQPGPKRKKRRSYPYSGKKNRRGRKKAN